MSTGKLFEQSCDKFLKDDQVLFTEFCQKALAIIPLLVACQDTIAILGIVDKLQQIQSMNLSSSSYSWETLCNDRRLHAWVLFLKQCLC